MVPKYIFDAALVIGGFILAATLFATQDAVSAVGTLALFLAAGTRVMPSLLRLQGAAVGIRGAAASAEPTFRLAADLNHPVDLVEQPSNALRIRERIQRGNPDFIPMVSVRSITVTYPGSASPALADVSLEVSAGETVALVGPSGAGKSTLADAILGVVAPDFGAVLLNELPPGACIDRWPGALAYVPQHVVLSNDSVRSNVALGLPREAIDDELVWQALNKAHVADIFRSQSDGLDSLVGENGLRLSGGQRQRIGIARALYTRPRLLVLDEATSNLDAESEKLITETTRSLGGDVTTIVVAHRIATVRDFAKIAYLDHGKVLAVGSFREVATEVPAFKRQAMLMGVDTNL